MPRIIDRGRCDAIHNGPQSYSTIGHVISPIPAGLPYLTGGPLVSPSPIGASGSIPWAKMPHQFGSPPSAAGADTGLEGVFHSPLPHGVSHHPLWSPPGAAYHVTAGGAFREGASNMSFFNRYSPAPHLTIDQLQYLSLLFPASTSSTPPHGLCSPKAIHQGAASGPTSPAWLTEQYRHPAALNTDTARYQDTALDPVTSSLNQQLLDYYKGLIVTGNVPLSPAHQLPSIWSSPKISRDLSQSSTYRNRVSRETAEPRHQNNDKQWSSTGKSSRGNQTTCSDDSRLSRHSTPRRHQRRLWNTVDNSDVTSDVTSDKSSSLLNIVHRLSPDKTSTRSRRDQRVLDKSRSVSTTFQTSSCMTDINDRKQYSADHVTLTKTGDSPLNAIITSASEKTAETKEELAEEEEEIDVCAVVEDVFVLDSLRTDKVPDVSDRLAGKCDIVTPGSPVQSVKANCRQSPAECVQRPPIDEAQRPGCQGSASLSSWRLATDVGHDVKSSAAADRIVKPAACDLSSMTSRYDGGTQRSEWTGIAPELGRLHVMTHPLWENPAAASILFHPTMSAPFMPANYALTEPSLPHLFDGQRPAAASGLKMYSDPVTGQCYFFPDFSWTNLYDRSRLYEESPVNLARHLSPTTSECLERKVKCEQLSPATLSATTHYESERKPNTEQLRLSLAMTSSSGGKAERPDIQRSHHRGEVGWPGVGLLSAVNVRQKEPSCLWTGGRTVAVESRGTSPLVEHCKLDPDAEVIAVVQDSEETAQLVRKSDASVYDVSGDSAIDLSTQSNDSFTVSGLERREDADRKRTDDVEHSVSVDIPLGSRSSSVQSLDSREVTPDVEVDSILGIVDMTPCVTSSADASARDVTIRFPIEYELERITPVDEVESTSCPSPATAYLDDVSSSQKPPSVQHVVAVDVSTVSTVDEATTSGLDILSAVASQRPMSPEEHTSDSGLIRCEEPASRRFSILDLPLSEMIESHQGVESPSTFDAAYNGPTLQHCATSDDCDAASTSGLGVLDPRVQQHMESIEVKPGDVFTSLKVDCGPEHMDPIELDVRMRMADLQVKYREKQRELARLQRRRSVGSADCISGGESRSARRKTLASCQSRSRMSSFSAASKNVAHKMATKLWKDESLSPTYRNVFDDVMADIQTAAEDKGQRTLVSGTSKKRRKTEETQLTDDLSKKPTLGFVSNRKGQGHTSSAKQKNEGRMTIKSNSNARRNSCRKLIAIAPTNDDNKHSPREDRENSPGFYVDEWYRRRSERIFLHKTADDLSPTRVKLASPTTTKRSTNTVSVTSSATRSCDASAYNGRAPGRTSFGSKTSDAVLFGSSYHIEPSTGTEMSSLINYAYSSSSDSSSSSSSVSSDDEGSELSDAEDMPLSAYINRNITLVNKTSALQQEDIVSGLRVLFLKDGLFFEGTVNELMPPDVYSVSIDGERGNRPNIVSREELLEQSVLIVRPHSSKDLCIGSRVCAYWSQKFSCLHPGTVCKPNSDSSTDGEDDDIRVDFDDGDAGKIPVDFIRMLPPDFAIQAKNHNSMFAKTPRKRRNMSGDASNKTKNCVDVDPSSDPSRWKRGHGNDAVDDPSTTTTLMTLGNSHSSELKLTIRRSISCSAGNEQEMKKEVEDSDVDDVSEDVKSSSSKAEESDSDVEELRKKQTDLNRTGRRKKRIYRKENRDSSGSGVEISGKGVNKRKRSLPESGKKRQRKRSSSGSQIGSFLAAWQQWRWVGNSTQRPGLKGRAKKLFYKAIRRGNEVIKIGDTTAFVSNTRHLKYIGRVISFWSGWDGTMWVRVKWFYHPEEANGGSRLVETKRALFESPHEDENDVQTISHKCDVMSYTDYTRYRQETASGFETGSRNSQKSRDVYYLAGSYDPYAKQICSFEDDVKVNPD